MIADVTGDLAKRFRTGRVRAKFRKSVQVACTFRDRYKKLCPELPMADEKYRVLCELSTHPVPQMTPQKFNQFDRPMTGGLFMQEAGLMVVLNEAAGILGCIADLPRRS